MNKFNTKSKTCLSSFTQCVSHFCWTCLRLEFVSDVLRVNIQASIDLIYVLAQIDNLKADFYLFIICYISFIEHCRNLKLTLGDHQSCVLLMVQPFLSSDL